MVEHLQWQSEHQCLRTLQLKFSSLRLSSNKTSLHSVQPFQTYRCWVLHRMRGLRVQSTVLNTWPWLWILSKTASWPWQKISRTFSLFILRYTSSHPFLQWDGKQIRRTSKMDPINLCSSACGSWDLGSWAVGFSIKSGIMKMWVLHFKYYEFLKLLINKFQKLWCCLEATCVMLCTEFEGSWESKTDIFGIIFERQSKSICTAAASFYSWSWCKCQPNPQQLTCPMGQSLDACKLTAISLKVHVESSW